MTVKNSSARLRSRSELAESQKDESAAGAIRKDWIESSPSSRLLSRAIASVLGLLGFPHKRHEPLKAHERRRVIKALFHEGPRLPPFFIRFSSLMALAATIAAFGLISDSTAVVIGAMLVAPLMTPVLGIAAALVMAWPGRVIRQSALVAAGALICIGLTAIISFIIPGDPFPLPSELVARTSPNLLDLGIALAAGAAGAYGQMRRQASDALPGVAVAVALVPPVAVVGITLQMGEWQMALGALLLFLVNVAGIIAAASITFIACGFVPGRRLFTGRTSIASGLRLVALGVIIVVMQFGQGTVLPPTDLTANIVAAVEEFVATNDSAAEVVDVSVKISKEVTDVNVVLVANPVEPPPVSELAFHLADHLKTDVEVTMQVVETQTNKASIYSGN